MITSTTKVYKVKFVSLPSAIVVVIVLLIAFFVLVASLTDEQRQSIPVALFVGIPMILSWLLWQKFVTGRTEWTITEDGVTMVWTKRPLERTKDFNLQWTEIAKISQGRDTQYYHLKILLTSDEKLSFFHHHLTTRDDFEELMKILHERVK